MHASGVAVADLGASYKRANSPNDCPGRRVLVGTEEGGGVIKGGGGGIGGGEDRGGGKEKEGNEIAAAGGGGGGGGLHTAGGKVNHKPLKAQILVTRCARRGG